MLDFLGVSGNKFGCDMDYEDHGCHELICREEMNFSRLEILSWGMFHCGETWGAKTKRPESKLANCRKNGRRNDMGLPSKDIYI